MIPNLVFDRLETRKALNITINDLAIGFIGRYNFDKGYDRFLSIAAAHKKDIRMRFFSAGAGEIQEAESNVFNLGWRKDIAEIISAMDLIIVPNAVTYFDLLPIESLMLGTPVAVSAVGGNKWLLNEVHDNSVQELKLYTEGDNLKYIIDSLKQRVEFRNSNLYNYFNDYAFINAHEKLWRKIEEIGGIGL
jgi:glycosyltransferase involved in cell wall biosynthesis